MNKLPAHFCILPWVHISINPDGGVIPCSKRAVNPFGNLKTESLKSIWTGEKFESFRKSMVDKQPSERCMFCTKLRESGLQPYNVYENRNYPEAIFAEEWQKDGKLVGDAKPVSLEFRFSNICNLRCRTCFPKFSTAWYPEAKEVYGESPTKPDKSFHNPEHFLSTLNEYLENIKSIQILGGEPLIHDEFYLLLERLIETGKTGIKFKVTTNLTRLTHKHWNLVELSKHFSNFVISASLDGAGPQSDFLRKGSSWNEIERNFQQLRQVSHIKFNLYPVISVLNSFHITAAIERWIELGMLTERYSLGMIANFVTAKPIYYNIRILNESERERLRDHYREFLCKIEKKVSKKLFERVEKYLQGILNYLDNGRLPEHREEFCRITRILDKSRNENLISLFPELESIFNSGNSS